MSSPRGGVFVDALTKLLYNGHQEAIIILLTDRLQHCCLNLLVPAYIFHKRPAPGYPPITVGSCLLRRLDTRQLTLSHHVVDIDASALLQHRQCQAEIVPIILLVRIDKHKVELWPLT